MTHTTIDPESVVLGILMQLPPATAAPYLDRLDRLDFADPRARETFTLLADLVAAGVPTLDPAALLAHALNTATGDLTNQQMQLLTRWVFDAYATTVVPVALDHHIGLVIEAGYRRLTAAFGTRLAQIAHTQPLADLHASIDYVTTVLARHRARLADATPAARISGWAA